MNLEDFLREKRQHRALDIAVQLATAKRELILLEMAKLKIQMIEIKQNERRLKDLVDRKEKLSKMERQLALKSTHRYHARVAHFG